MKIRGKSIAVALIKKKPSTLRIYRILQKKNGAKKRPLEKADSMSGSMRGELGNPYSKNAS